jgi:hypothetical protein
MSVTPSKVKAFVIRKFKDDGTKQSFAETTIVEIEAGSFTNYEAAGLVRKPTAEDIKAVKDTAEAASKAGA